MDTLQIAEVCHETIRAYCALHGDFSQPSWKDAQDWQKQSSVAGVLFCQNNPDAGDAGQHNQWMGDKIADGWVYGPVKDVEKKEHPCIVDFDKLPEFQQRKDRLFRAVSNALS